MEIKCSYKKLIPPEQLVLHNQNTNKHPEKQIDLLAKLLKYQGFRVPIIVSNLSGMIVSGNGRREAAIKAGFAEVPVDFQDFENKTQEMAFLESDNLVADLAEHDTNAMIDNMRELELGDDFDLELFGALDLNIMPVLNEFDLDEKTQKDKDIEWKLEAKFPNEMEMRDYHDDLLARGYIVKILGE